MTPEITISESAPTAPTLTVERGRTVCVNASPFAPAATAAPFAVIEGMPFPACPVRVPSTTTVYQDALARIQPDPYPQLPPYPRIANPLAPTTADLLLLAQWVQAIAMLDHHEQPHFIIGALRSATELMTRNVKARLDDEERELMLTERLRHEHNQECAHEKLMREDPDYADEIAAEMGEFDDEVPL